MPGLGGSFHMDPKLDQQPSEMAGGTYVGEWVTNIPYLKGP